MSLFQGRICRVCHSCKMLVSSWVVFFFLVYNDINSTASYGPLFHYLLFRKLPCSQYLISVILALVKYLTHYSFPLVSVDYCYVPTLLFSFPNSLMLLTHICYPVELPDPFLKKQLTDFSLLLID